MAQEDEVVDVLVAGTGAAGCAAACAALSADSGLRVLVLEKAKHLIGGTTKLAGGGWLWAPGNPFLREMGVAYDPEETLALLRALAHPDGSAADAQDDELMRSFAEDWPGVVAEIMRERVMVLQEVSTRAEEDSERVEALLHRKLAAHPELRDRGFSDANLARLRGLMASYCCEHPLDLCPSGKVLAPSGGTTSSQLEKSARRLGAEFRLGAQVVDLVMDDAKSRVTGVRVRDAKTQAVHTIHARRGVVFGTGGFSHQPELMAEHFPGNVPFGTCSAKTNTGDLAQMAARHGIPVSGMHLAWLKQVVLPFDFRRRLGVFFNNADSFLIVDRSGRRFANEKHQYNERGLEMRGRADRRCVFFVYDARAAALFDGPIKSLGGPIPSEDAADDCVVSGADAEALTAGIADKLRHVCPEFSLEPDFARTLDAQLDRFNAFAREGLDGEFQRGVDAGEYCWSVPRAKDNAFKSKVMFPVDKAQLRCVILGLSTLDTKGGPRINRDGQILDASMKPVVGLYGAGNCVRSATNDSYPASGATLSNAILFGWQAGKHVARRSPKL